MSGPLSRGSVTVSSSVRVILQYNRLFYLFRALAGKLHFVLLLHGIIIIIIEISGQLAREISYFPVGRFARFWLTFIWRPIVYVEHVTF